MTRIMLVDDDRDLSELLAGQLTRAGHDVRFADSLTSAKEVVRAEAPFQVLITDLHLPDADGIEVAAALGIPLQFALTGSSSKLDEQRLLAAGFAVVLVKPLTARQVVDVLNRTLAEAK